MDNDDDGATGTDQALYLAAVEGHVTHQIRIGRARLVAGQQHWDMHLKVRRLQRNCELRVAFRGMERAAESRAWVWCAPSS